MLAEYDGTILEHYRTQANHHGLQPSSTMADEVTRTKEVGALLSVLRYLNSKTSKPLRILEVGCGNGYLLEQIRESLPSVELVGRDYSPDMVALAQTRYIENCRIAQGDVRILDVADESFDVVISERCLINLLLPSDQRQALFELHRVLSPRGHVLFLEAFTDGLTNLNRARAQLGLSEHDAPYHNLWFDKHSLCTMLDGRFTMFEARELDEQLPGANFLSSHYFISRVLYPSLTQAEVRYNTDFVRFFQFLAPIGNYSPIQLYMLRKLR